MILMAKYYKYMYRNYEILNKYICYLDTKLII